MRKLLFASCLAGVLALGAAATAQTASNATENDQAPVGKQAGTFMIRVRGIGVLPEDSASSTSVGGHVKASDAFAPEVDLSYFFTDNIAGEVIAATTRHDITATGTAVGDVKVGSTWALPPTVLVQYHFMPHQALSPYVGVGLNATFFYSNHPARPTVTSLSLQNNVGAALQAGLDYNVAGHWFANVDVKQLFLQTHANVGTVLGPVRASTSLNPLVIGAGIGYRF